MPPTAPETAWQGVTQIRIKRLGEIHGTSRSDRGSNWWSHRQCDVRRTLQSNRTLSLRAATTRATMGTYCGSSHLSRSCSQQRPAGSQKTSEICRLPIRLVHGGNQAEMKLARTTKFRGQLLYASNCVASNCSHGSSRSVLPTCPKAESFG